MDYPSRRPFTSFLLLIALFAGGRSEFRAGAATWLGNTSNAFGTASNWDIAPSSGASLLFGSAGSSGLSLNNNLTPGFNFIGIQFIGPSAFTIGGNAFVLSGPIVNETSLTQTINNNITLTAGTHHFQLASGSGLVLGGDINGAGGLQLELGTFTLTGANTYTGGTSLIGGATLQIGDGSPGGGGSITGNITNNGAIIFNRTGSSSLAGVISGGGSLSVAKGTFILTGANTYTGGTTIDSGATLQLGDGTGSPNGTGSVDKDKNITNNGTLIFNRAADFGFDGVISGSGGMTVNAGVMRPTKALAYAGLTQITNAALVLASTTIGANESGLASSSVVILGSNGRLDLANHQHTIAGLVSTSGFGQVYSFSSPAGTAGGLTVTVASGQTYAFSGLLGDADPNTAKFFFTKAGPGTQILSGNNTYTGGTTISEGTLQLGNGGASGSIATASAITVAQGATLAFNRSDDYTFGGVITGSGGVAMNGNVLRFAAAQTYTGPTQINNNGILVLPTTGALAANISALAPGTVVTIGATAKVDTSNRSQTIAGLAGVGTLYSFGGSAGKLTLKIASGQSYTFSGVLGGPSDSLDFAVVKSDPGTQILAGANTYIGTTAITEGTLQFAKRTSLYNGTTASWTAAKLTVASGATLALNVGGTNEFAPGDLNTLFTNISVANSATTGLQGGAKLAFDTTNASGGTFSLPNALSDSTGAFGGAIGLVKVGSGTLAVVGVNGYTGGTTINSGTLSLSGVLPAGGATTINDGGTLALSGQLGASAISTFGTGILSQTSTGVINGASSLTLAGSGISVLGGTNSYTGATAINSGTLSLTGAINGSAISTSGSGVLSETSAGSITGASSLTVAGSGISVLGGTNSYTGATAVNSGTLSLTGTISGSAISTSGSGALSETSTGKITGASSLTVTGSGTSILAGVNNTYTGATTINGGTLQSTANGTLSPNSAITVNNTATLAVNYGGASDYTEAQTAALLLPARTTFGATTAVFAFDTTNLGANGTATYGTALTMNGSLTKLGVGTLALAGANIYAGATRISGGTLQVGNGGTTGSLPASSAITDNGTLVFNRSNTVTQGVDFAGAISGSGGVTQAGSGTLILSGTNSYSGPTVVNAGTLQVSGSLAGSLIANNGANLTLAVGPSAPLAVGNDVTLNTTIANVVLNATPTPGQSLRVLNYTGTLTGSAANFTSTQLRSPVFSTATAHQVNLTFATKTLTWTGTPAATWDLNNSANWTDGVGAEKFFVADAVTFNDSGTNKTVTVNTVVLPSSVTFANTTGSSYTLNGTGSIQSGITQNASGSGAVTINVPLTGGSTLTKSGAGTLTLSALNPYTGATAINAGTLSLTGTLSGTAITTSGTGILSQTAAGVITGPSSLAVGAGTSTLAGANTYTGSTTISGGTLSLTGSLSGTAITTSLTGTLSQTGTGTITGASSLILAFASTGTSILAGANTYTGLTDIRGGTLSLTGSLSGTVISTLGTGILSQTVTGSITGASSLSLSGTGTSVLAGVNTYTGTTSIGGTLSLSGSINGSVGVATISTLGSAVLLETATGSITGNRAIFFGGTGTSVLAGVNTYTGPTSIDGSATLSLSGSLSGTQISTTSTGILSETATGTITGNRGINLSGTGTSILAGTNTYTGTTRVDTGTLQLGNGGTTGSLSPSSGITLNSSSSKFVFNRSNTITQGTDFGTISGSGSVVHQGPGTLIFTGANNYTGGTTISAGSTLQVGTGGADGGALPGAIANNGTFILNRSDAITQGTDFGVIGGSGSFVLQGPATVTMVGGNTYTGPTQVNAGTLVLSADYALSSSTVVTVAAGAGLDFSDHSQTFAGLEGAGAVNTPDLIGCTLTLDIQAGQTHLFSGIIYPNHALGLTKDGPGTQILAFANYYGGVTRINAGTLQIGNGGTAGTLPVGSEIVNNSTLVFNRSDTITQSGHFPENIHGSGGVTMEGSGTLVFHQNTYTGPTQVNAGTLVLSAVNALSSASVVTVAAGASLDLAGRNQAFGGLNGAGTVYSLNSTTSILTLEILPGQTRTFSGTIGGAYPNFGLTKDGLGTQVLSGLNGYTQATLVNNGTLEVDGSIAASSGTSVSAGATLRGHGRVSVLSGAGSIDPNLEILTGTKVDPSGGLDFAFRFTQPGAPIYSNAAASGNDVLHLTDSTPFVMSLTANNVITVDLTGVTLTVGQTFLGGFFLDASVPDSLLSNASFVYTGMFGIVQYNGLVTVPSASFATGSVTNGKVMEFKVVAIPEPGSAPLALVGGLALLLRRWRKTARRSV